MPAPDSISCDKLAKLIGTPKAPIILDVRREALREADPRAIPTARLLTDGEIKPSGSPALLPSLVGQAVVVACAAGHGRSQGLACGQDSVSVHRLSGRRPRGAIAYRRWHPPVRATGAGRPLHLLLARDPGQ